MISVSNVTKFYGDNCAVNNISFVIRKGEITGLLGPNGAGKTTTLRMLTCYLKPTSGKISVADMLVDENPIGVKKLIGYLPESAPLYGDLMVYDYLQYVGRIRGIDERTRIREIADLCGIKEVMHKNIGELSKGYKQRVGLAHAMFHNPEILILDEPTSGLDPNQIQEIRKIIKEIGKKKTVILSTHILTEVEATCDRVIIIDRGHIIADSKTSELKSAAMTGRKVAVKISGTDFGSFAESMRNISGVDDVAEKDDGGELTSAVITSAADSDIRPQIFSIVRDKGWILYEMAQEKHTLEHIFRELTTGGANDI